MSPRENYTRKKMRGVPVDDDTIYTLLGLLIAEEHGPGFSTADVGASWIKYLPYACTAEDVALKNHKKGIQPVTKKSQNGIPFRPLSSHAQAWPHQSPSLLGQ